MEAAQHARLAFRSNCLDCLLKKFFIDFDIFEVNCNTEAAHISKKIKFSAQASIFELRTKSDICNFLKTYNVLTAP